MSAIRAEQADALGGCAPCQPAAPPDVTPKPEGRPAGPPAVVVSRDKPSWLAIELVDETGAPIVGEPFEVALPDGQKITGILDKRGTVRLDGVDPGMCRVSFPERDRDGWRRG